jgi:glycine cleavage system H protein
MAFHEKKGGYLMDVEGYNIPEDLYYDKNHYWARVEGDLVIMGMNDYAQKMAGEIVYVQLPEEGKRLKSGKKFAAVESGKWLGKVYAPVNGELVGVNEELEENPGLINEDCYGKGWMYKIKADDMNELETLMRDPDDLREWLKAEIAEHGETR